MLRERSVPDPACVILAACKRAQTGLHSGQRALATLEVARLLVIGFQMHMWLSDIHCKCVCQREREKSVPVMMVSPS